MNSRTVLMRRLAILGIASLVLVAGCGGNSSQSTNNQPTPPTGVSVSPSSVTVIAGGVQQFTATLTPSGANQALTWSVSGTGCTGANCGTISSTGMYTAPANVPNPPTVTITATLVADSAKSGSATVTVAPSPAAPSATLLIRDTPPAGVAVLSFSATVTGAVLAPGDVNLVTSPVTVEINRLQVEAALLANLTIPSGTYTSLTVTFANPVLTILNNSGAANGSCANGAICKLRPALGVSSVNFTGPPFPVTGHFDLLLDFDLSKSLSDLGTINPVVTLRQLTPADLNQRGVSVKQVAGKIIYVAGDTFCCGAFFDLVTDMGTINSVDDSFAHYVDATTVCGNFFCVQDKIAEVDLTLPSGGGTFWEAQRVTLKPPDQPELEGVVVAINSDAQFDIVLLHQMPGAAGLEMGDLVRINLQSGATIEAVDIDVKRNGLLFSAPSDLLVGQVVTARARSAPSGAPLAVTADRVRLKSGALTGLVKSILNATDFVVDSLPGNFPSSQIQVRTNAQNVAALNVGDTVSFSGFLLKTSGAPPVLLAEGVRRR